MSDELYERFLRVHEDQIKVTYTTLTGYETKAYVSESTLEGTNKHTDEPVKLFFSDVDDKYHEMEIDLPIDVQPLYVERPKPERGPQPKRLSRAQRKGKK